MTRNTHFLLDINTVAEMLHLSVYICRNWMVKNIRSNTPPIPPQSTIYLKTSASYLYPFWKNFNLHLSFTGWTLHLYSIWILLTADFHLPKHDETRIKDTRDFILSGSWRVPHPRSVAVPCHWVKWSSQSWTKCWRRKKKWIHDVYVLCKQNVNKDSQRNIKM